MWTHVMSWHVGLWVWFRWVAGWTARLVRRPVRAWAGQSTVEYAVVAALIVVAAMAAIQYFTQGVTTVFQHIVQKLGTL